MPIQNFNFGNTHSYGDHCTVARARETINGLPLQSGYLRLSDQFSLGTIIGYINGLKNQATSEERQIAARCADGQNASTIERHRENLRTINQYLGALETIREYMTNYSRCGC